MGESSGTQNTDSGITGIRDRAETDFGRVWFIGHKFEENQ
jgi:hypothetical protein